MDGKRVLASITASVDQNLLRRNAYLVTEKWRHPPKRVQKSGAAMPGGEVVARGASSLQPSMPRNCNQTFVSCCSMHVAICFYDAHGRRLSLTPGARDAFLHTAMVHDRLPIISARRTPWGRRRYMPDTTRSQ